MYRVEVTITVREIFQTGPDVIRLRNTTDLDAKLHTDKYSKQGAEEVCASIIDALRGD